MQTDPSPPSPSFGAELLRGLRACVPLALSVSVYGLVWGVLAGQTGLSILEVLAMSGLVFAGASQFVALDLWMPGTLPIGALIAAAAVVNLRMMLMTATLRPTLSSLPRWQGLLATLLTTDETWALTIGQRPAGRDTAGFFVGAGLMLWSTWLAVTLAGRLLGAAIAEPESLGLDFAFTATFIALLLGMWKGRADLVPWIVGGGVAVLVTRLVPGEWHILAGGLCGSLAGAIADTIGRRREAGR
ncbi:MAG: AzlC family ABC transporter permease [Devosia sp.]